MVRLETLASMQLNNSFQLQALMLYFGYEHLHRHRHWRHSHAGDQEVIEFN
jgi:hypothetical protein